MKVPRCRTCGNVLEDDGSCERCEFRPKLGKLASGYQRHRGNPIPAREQVDAEDDYSEESGPDSVYHERSAVDPANRLRRRP